MVMTGGLCQSREINEHLALETKCPLHLIADIVRERSESNLLQINKREDGV